MKSHKINENEEIVCVCVELNKRNFINEPIETIQRDTVELLLRTAGHNTEELEFTSGPVVLTNYRTKGQPPAVLMGEWVFNKKQKKVKKDEIKITPVTSKRGRARKKTKSEG